MDFRIIQAVSDQFEKFALANFQEISRSIPIYKVTYMNEQVFEVLSKYQAKTKVIKFHEQIKQKALGLKLKIYNIFKMAENQFISRNILWS